MIKIIGLNKSYITGVNQLHVLKNIDLHIEAGEFISIMGSSIFQYFISHSMFVDKNNNHIIGYNLRMPV